VKRGWIVAFASSKGGPGKTTAVIAVGVDLALQGYRVTMLDADPNGHLTEWWRLAAHDKVRVVGGVGEEDILDKIREEAALADFLFIDLEGTATNTLTYATSKSDLVVIPAQPSRMDLHEAFRGVAFLERASKVVERTIPYRVLLSKMPVLPTRAARHARAQLDRQGLLVFKTELLARTVFKEMTFHGKTPRELDPESNATRNVRALADEIADVLCGKVVEVKAILPTRANEQMVVW
jgi:chromosome partitioning protein